MKSWLIGKTDAGRDWGQAEKGTTEDEMAGWHRWLDGRESEWTPGVGDGQGGLGCCDSWGRKESDTTEGLIWSDLIWRLISCISCKWSETWLCILRKHPSELPLVLSLVVCGFITWVWSPEVACFLLPGPLLVILAASLGYANKAEWIAADLLSILHGWIWGCVSSDWSSEWEYNMKGMLSPSGETRGVPSSSWWSPHYQSWLNVGAAVGRRKRLCVK